MGGKTWARVLAVTVAAAVSAVTAGTAAGCGGRASTVSGTSSTSTVSGTSSTSTGPAPDPHRLAVDYRRSGGLIGRVDHLNVNDDGVARLRTRTVSRRTTLGRALRKRLARALRQADLAHLRSRYGTQVPDGFAYVVTHSGHTVRAFDPSVPPRLQRLIGVLNQIIAKLGG